MVDEAFSIRLHHHWLDWTRHISLCPKWRCWIQQPTVQGCNWNSFHIMYWIIWLFMIFYWILWQRYTTLQCTWGVVHLLLARWWMEHYPYDSTIIARPDSTHFSLHKMEMLNLAIQCAMMQFNCTSYDILDDLISHYRMLHHIMLHCNTATTLH